MESESGGWELTRMSLASCGAINYDLETPEEITFGLEGEVEEVTVVREEDEKIVFTEWICAGSEKP